MGPDDYIDDSHDDDFDDWADDWADDMDDEGLDARPMPDPSERTWRHPAEIAAQARAEAELAATEHNSAIKAARVPSPALVVAAGLVFGIVMVGLIQSSRSTSPGPEAASPSFSLSPGNEAITFPVLADQSEERLLEGSPGAEDSLTAPVTTWIPTSTLVPTTYTNPKSIVRLARPEGVFRVYAADRSTVLGSAVAIDDMILSSASCLEGHHKVYLSSSLGSATMMEASTVGTDGFSDLAVLTTNAPLTDFNLAHSPLTNAGHSERVTVIGGGETFLADASSGKVLELDTRTKSANGYQLAGIASTSVQISKQDAGGGLFDSNQVLVGLVVNTDEHLASVLPIEEALLLAKSLARTGWMTPNWAGITGSSHPDGGILIDTVSGDSPAELAGIEAGDSIVSIDGSGISTMADLIHYIRALESGSSIELILRRDAELLEVRVELGLAE